VRRLNRRVAIAVGLGLAGVAAVGWTIAGAQSDDTPRGTDPLSAEEVETAAAQAQGSGHAESGGLGADDVVLRVERHEEDKAVEDTAPRRADVYVYSYDDDVLTLTVVNVDTGHVDSSATVPNTQLPLIREEQDRAIQLAMDDPSFAQRLSDAYHEATGRALTDVATEVEVEPIVFRADSNAATVGAARQCGRHRCAQLMLQSTDDLLIDLLPVIDLSAGRVVSQTGFFS
jgi:hypothetical protein